MSRQSVITGAAVAYLAVMAWMWIPRGGGGGPSPLPSPDGEIDQAIVQAMKATGNKTAAKERAALYAGIAEMVETKPMRSRRRRK